MKARSRRKTGPNILLIVADALRADRLSCYGYNRPTTPELDALAREGTRFEYAYTASRWSLPAYASLFTGASVSRHGVGADATGVRDLADARWCTLPEFLGSRHYQTAGFSNNTFVGRDFGFHRGFGYFRETWKLLEEQDAAFYWLQRLGGHGFRTGKRRNLGFAINDLYFRRIDKRWERGEKGAARTNRLFARWLDYLWNDHKPFFGFVLYLEPHTRYWPPEPFRSAFLTSDPRYAKELSGQAQRAYDYLTGKVLLSEHDFAVLSDLYDGQVSYADSRLGQLVKVLKRGGVLDDTVLIVTADHGECLGEHRALGHASPSLHEPAIRVPLIIRYPPVYGAAEVVSSPVSVIDIYRTIVDLVGGASDMLSHQLQGASLLPPRLQSLEDRPVVIESLDSHRRAFAKIAPHFDIGQYDYLQRAIRWRQYKLIWKSRSAPELYEVAADPGEQTNLAGDNPQLAAELQHRLDEWLASFEHCSAGQGPGDEIDTAVLSHLAALGYVGL